MFLIKRKKDGKLTLTGKETIEINGCSGPVLLYIDDENKTRRRKVPYTYKTRKDAENAIEKYNIDGEVYFYRGCGCCSTLYEDIDGTIKYAMWLPWHKTKKDRLEFLAYLKYMKAINKKHHEDIDYDEYLNYLENNESLLKD